MNVVLKEIGDSLRGVGKKINYTPQEKLLNNAKEVLILISNVDIKPETNKTYFVTTTVEIMWKEENGFNMIENIVGNMATIEEGFTTLPANFQFDRAIINMLGVAYGVTLPCTYQEVVTIS